MRRSAGLKPHKTGGQRSKKLQQLVAPHRFGDHNPPRSINAVNLKDVLAWPDRANSRDSRQIASCAMGVCGYSEERREAALPFAIGLRPDDGRGLRHAPPPRTTIRSSISKSLLGKYTIEFSSRRVRVSFELHDRRPIVAAIDRAVLDPSPETLVGPQFSPDLCAEIAGVRIYKTWRETATATVAVNKPNASGAHLPRLLNYLTKG